MGPPAPGGIGHAPASVARHTCRWEGMCSDWRIARLHVHARTRSVCAPAHGCAARVGFPAPDAVSPSAGEPFPLQWGNRSDQLQNTAKCDQTPTRVTSRSGCSEVAEMSHAGVGPRPVRPSAALRGAAFLATGAFAVSALAGCSSKDPAGKPLAGPDVAPAARALIADGGTLRWAVDDVPETLNTFQSDADAATGRVAQAVLPSMFRPDAKG